MNYAEIVAAREAQRLMLAALEAGTATPEQQQAAFAHIQTLKQRHAQDLRDADREARDAYREGRWQGAEDERERGCY